MLLAAGNQLRKTEEDQLKMWVSADHPYRKNTEWLNENKPASDIKANSVLIKTDLNGDKNLLSAAVIKKLYQLRKKIANINANVADSKVTWEYTCYRQRVNKGNFVPGLSAWDVTLKFTLKKPRQPLPAAEAGVVLLPLFPMTYAL